MKMPRVFRIVYGKSSDDFSWTLFADDDELCRSPEKYPDEDACKNEIRALKNADVKKREGKGPDTA
jgi:hypothetical protein